MNEWMTLKFWDKRMSRIRSYKNNKNSFWFIKQVKNLKILLALSINMQQGVKLSVKMSKYSL